MASSTVENYLKHILVCQQEGEKPVVSMGQVARALEVTPGTATTMVKSMARGGLLHYEPRHGVTLTQQGRASALQVLRRHRLIEFFLVEKLKMDWAEIHEEAELLEHAISDRLLERLDAYLGHPKFDPHGDAIPTADGEMAERVLCGLDACQAGQIVTVARLNDQDTAFLGFAREHGLMPGFSWRVHSCDAQARCLHLVSGATGDSLTLGLGAAAKIWVELDNEA